MTLGNKIKSLRAEHNLSQPDLAAKIGIEQSYLSKLENGKSIPSNDIFNNILDAFGISLEKFLASFSNTTDVNTLKQIPDVRLFLSKQKEVNLHKRRRLLYVSSLLIIIALTVFYAGFSKKIFPTLQYQYESEGVILAGEPDNIFDHRQVIKMSDELKIEIQSRANEKVLISNINRGKYFVTVVNGGSRKYHYDSIILVPQSANGWLQVLGVLLFSAGLMGFVLERRL